MIKEKLNIVQIIWHDLGRHLSCYGEGTVSSPHIDRMAQEGILFKNHFSTGTVCTPSRASILTGRYPHSQDLWRFSDQEITLPKILQQAGYSTYRFGFREEREFIDIGGLGQNVDLDKEARELIGYEYTISESRNSMELANQVCNFFDNNLLGEPFYVNIAFYDVHRPNEIHIDDDTINNTKLPKFLPTLPDTYESKKDVAMLEKRINLADKAVGKILDNLRANDLNKKTLVLFTTDHGIDLPRAKMTVYDAGIQTALICWGPEFIPSGTVDINLHSHMDIFPTLLDLIGIPIPDRVQGESFALALIGKDYKERDFVLAERSWESSDDPVRAIRTKEYKYIKNFCPGWPIPIPPDYSKKVGVQLMNELYSTPRPEEELYDLIEDPYEMNNLAERLEYQKIKEKLKEKLFDILEEGNDEVLSLGTYLSKLKEFGG